MKQYHSKYYIEAEWNTRGVIARIYILIWSRKSSLVSRFSLALSKKGEIDGVHARHATAFRQFLSHQLLSPLLNRLYPLFLSSCAFLPCFARFPNTISKKLKSGPRHSTDTAVSSTRKLTKFALLLDRQTKCFTSSQVQWNTTTGVSLLSDVPRQVFDAIDYRCVVWNCCGESWEIGDKEVARSAWRSGRWTSYCCSCQWRLWHEYKAIGCLGGSEAKAWLTLDAFCRRVGDVGESGYWWGNCSCMSIWGFPDNSLDLWKMPRRRLLREGMPWLHLIRNRIGGIPFVNVNWYYSPSTEDWKPVSNRNALQQEEVSTRPS